MGFILPPGLQDAVQRFDPSVEILWNNRIKRWVVAQFGPTLHPVVPALLGVTRITGKATHYTPIFTCELETEETHVPGAGVPVEPGDWIIAKLHGLRPYKYRTAEQYDQQVKDEEYRKEQELERKLDDVFAAQKADLLKYGKKGDDIRSARHFTISGNPAAGG